MTERNFALPAGMLILALVLVLPVSADNTITVHLAGSTSAVAGDDVATPPGVIVKDGTGQPIEGITVEFTVTGGQGTVLPASVITGPDGTAAVTSWTLGTTAGPNELMVSANPVNGTTPLTITATGEAGPATQIAKDAGDLQEATAGTAVATPPSVRVMDAHNNPVSGATVSFVATTPASASVTGGSQTTGTDGIATVGSWTLGTVTGSNELTATTGSHSVTFTAQATESTAPPTISAISPSVGLNTGTISGVAITGTQFSASGVTVELTKSGEANITGSCTRNSATAITCSFALADADDGAWNVVVTNADGKSVARSSGFTVYKESDSDVSITSISPAAAMAGDNVDFTITGKDFITAMTYEVYLYNSDYDENITAEDVEVKSATGIKGTFDLDDDAEVDTYQLCIRDGFGGTECKKNAFKITTNEVGSIEISSSPTGATILIDGVANGVTPKTVDDLVIGSYKITLKKSGYQDWMKTVKVEEDETTEVDATLYAAATTTLPATTIRTYTYQTTHPVTQATQVRTTAQKTFTLPTTLAETPTTPEESPVEPLLVVGTLCIAFVILRKR